MPPSISPEIARHIVDIKGRLSEVKDQLQSLLLNTCHQCFLDTGLSEVQIIETRILKARCLIEALTKKLNHDHASHQATDHQPDKSETAIAPLDLSPTTHIDE